MSWLSDLLQAYGEGEALKRWGSGWREKLAQLRATTANLGYEGQRTQAQTRLYDTQGQAAAGELGADTATRDYFTKAGKTSQAVAKFLQDQTTAQAAAEASGTNTAESRAKTAALPSPTEAAAERKADLGVKRSLTAAHYADAEYHNRGGAAKPRLVKGPDGRQYWVTPGDNNGTPIFDAAAPTTQTQNRRDQANIIIQQGAALLNQLSDPEVAASLGTGGGLKYGALDVIGQANPKARGYFGAETSFESLLPILHGFRGGAALAAQFKQMLGSPLQDKTRRAQVIAQVMDMASRIANGTAEPEAVSPETLKSLGLGGMPGGTPGAPASPAPGSSAEADWLAKYGSLGAH